MIAGARVIGITGSRRDAMLSSIAAGRYNPGVAERGSGANVRTL